MMDCKRALEEAGGDMDKAAEILRKKGIAKAEKRTGKQRAKGVVVSYIHHNGKVGVLVEVNCETDFVARTDEFKELVREIALHIARAAGRRRPRRRSRGDGRARAAHLRGAGAQEGKPEQQRGKIVEGKVKKFVDERDAHVPAVRQATTRRPSAIS